MSFNERIISLILIFISAKNINRFINIEGINYTTKEAENSVGNNGITLN